MSSDNEERKSSLIPAMLEGIKIPVVQFSPKTSTNCDPNIDMEIDDKVDNEIKDIIANKDLKNKILEMVSQEWPFSCIKGQESWQDFLDITRRDISPNLSEELSKIDIINEKSDMSDLSKQKIKNYMFDIVQTLYNDEHLTGSQYSSEIEAKTKFEYEVIMKRVQENPNDNDDATMKVSMVGSDNVMHLSDDNTQFSLPIKSLITDRLEIKLDQRKSIEKSTDKIRQKLKKLKAMTLKNTKENIEDNITLEEIKLSEVSFHKEVTENLPDGSKLEIKLAVKFDKNGNQNFTFEQLKSLHILSMAKETKVDVQALLNYLRPFFPLETWNMSELNSKVKLLSKKKYSRDVEENILQNLRDLEDLSKLDSNCLMSFKEFCLEEICAFEIKNRDTENEIISHPNNNDVTIKRLHDIISTLIHIFPTKNQYEKEFHIAMFHKLERNLPISSDFKNLDKLFENVEEQTSTTDYITQKFHNFAFKIWCPILSENYLKIILPKVDEMITSEIDFSNDVEILSNLFKKLNTMSHIYCNDGHSEELAKTFEALFMKWAQDEKDIAEEHMTNLFYEEVKEKDAFEATKDSKEKNWKAFDQTIHIKRIFQKRHDDWNKKCDYHYVDAKQKEKYGKNLYEHLVGVLCSYATKLMKLIMRDNNFDKVEFVMFLNTMHGSVHFLNQLFKIDDKRFFTLGDHEHTFQSMLQDIKRQFVTGQQLIFQQKIENGEKMYDDRDEINEENLLGYLDGLINYIKDNLDLSCEGSEENHIQHLYQEILEDIATKMHEEIQDCEKEDKKEVTKALEELKRLRSGFNLDNVEENKKLEEDIRKSWLNSADDSELISNFVSTTLCHDLDQESKMGSLIFTVTKIPDTEKLEVTLKSLKDLKPRREDNLVNFSITISLFPFATQKHKTKVYNDISESYLFDLSVSNDSKETDDTYNATFDLPNDKNEDFLQFILYDHSRTKTNKIFLGMFFIPINEIKENSSSLEKNFHACPQINEKNDVFEELQNRGCKFVTDLKKFKTQKRTPSKSSLILTPSKKLSSPIKW